MFCKDQSVSFLKSFGYNVIRLPKADVQPLQILTLTNGTLTNLGQLATLLTTGSAAPMPVIRFDQPTSTISGRKTSDLSVGVGLSILGSIIGAMGGSKLGLETKYSDARTITFEYADVKNDSVEIAKLDQFLADADVNPLSQFVSQLLESDDIYVITNTIKSQKISVEAKRKDQTSVTVDIPEIKQLVGGNVAVSGDSDLATSVTFTGGVPLVFGFQAIRLIYENGRYTAFKNLPAGGGSIAMAPMQNVTSENQDKHDFLMVPGGLVNL